MGSGIDQKIKTRKNLNQHGVRWSLIHLWSMILSKRQFRSRLYQEQSMGGRFYYYHSPVLPRQSDTNNAPNEIGVGVYQGELVVFGRQLLDIPSQNPLDWEVCRPRMGELDRIGLEVPRLLHSVAFYLECEKRFYLSLRDLQSTSEGRQSKYSRYAILPRNCEFASSNVNDN